MVFMYAEIVNMYRNGEKRNLKQVRKILNDLAIEEGWKYIKRRVRAVTLDWEVRTCMFPEVSRPPAPPVLTPSTVRLV